MAFTQDDLDRLERAIAKGVKRVSYENQTVDYPSIEDMKIRRDLMRRALRTKKRRKQFRIFSGRGL